MTRTRKDVWKLGAGWSQPLVWYAKAVRELSSRPITDPTSWRFLAAMHGFDADLWRTFDYLGADEAFPPEDGPLWKQCQHESWYFLPWHRGYLASFEAIVGDAITKLGGPADWALPYWNYSDTKNPHARALPPAFAMDTIDGEEGPNPLKVKRRYGTGTGTIVINPSDVALRTTLIEPHYTGASAGGSPGFGGPQTVFSHSARRSGGLLEQAPHNLIHSRVGGFIRGGNENVAEDNGLMSMPDTAALDPIFWLHHANIDRLWQVWINRGHGHANPSTASWLTGPADRAFKMPRPDGTSITFAAKDMLETTVPALNYVYEDVSDPLAGTGGPAERRRRLGLPDRAVAAMAGGGTPVMPQQAAELIGANAASVRIDGASAETQVRLDPTGTQQVARSMAPAIASAPAQEPDRIFLNLENLTGRNDGAIFDVYVGLPPGADPKDQPGHFAGSVSMFGVAKATQGDAAHGGNGVTRVLEITDVIDALHLRNQLNVDQLNVRFVPSTDIAPRDEIAVGRVSIYRQGG